MPMGHSQSMHSDRHQFATNAGIDFGIIEFFRDVLPILIG